MNYYEELGISRTASEAEIRKSYKCLTLLLHPDQHQNPKIRALAEGQMKRINGIIETLTDPVRRRAYDKSLDEPALVVRQEQLIAWTSWVRGNRGWALVGLTFVLLLISPLVAPMFDSARSAREVYAPPRATSVSSLEKQKMAFRPESIVEPKLTDPEQRAAGDRKQAPGLRRRQPEDSQSSSATEDVSDGIGTVAAPDGASGPRNRDLPPAQSPPGAPRPAPTLAGKWVYTPDPSDPGDPKLYPAEYVELSIAPLGNTLRGVYQARYKLPDHTLNSRVSFTFEGSSAGTSFSWQGDSGAQGEIDIRMDSSDTLNVNWFATKMGSLSLGSGKATLYRFR
ncbi:MAG TPA: J domain-containing protein [Bryobacteraceae bacterium]|nr:J domain-containing protein [Bryobacteraceae bacterium]